MRSLLISSKHGEKSSPFHLDATCVFLGGVAPAVLPMIVLFRAFADPIFACNVNATLNIQHFQTRNTKQESLLSKNKRNCGFDYHFVMHSKEYPLIVDGLLDMQIGILVRGIRLHRHSSLHADFPDFLAKR